MSKVQTPVSRRFNRRAAAAARAHSALQVEPYYVMEKAVAEARKVISASREDFLDPFMLHRQVTGKAGSYQLRYAELTWGMEFGVYLACPDGRRFSCVEAVPCR